VECEGHAPKRQADDGPGGSGEPHAEGGRADGARGAGAVRPDADLVRPGWASVAVVPGSSVVSGEGGAVVRGHRGGVAAGELARSIRGCGLGGGWSRNPACAAYRVRQPRGLIDVPRRRSPLASISTSP